MGAFVDQVEAKINEVRDKLKKGAQEAFERALQKAKTMRSEKRLKERDEDPEEEPLLLNDGPVVSRLDVRSFHQEYIDSINFKKGTEVQMNMPLMFRKDSKAIEVKFSEI